MSVLLLVVSALHVLILILLFIATLDKAWWTLPGGRESVNLWYDCVQSNNSQTWACSHVSDNDWLRAVQALMVLSLLFCCFSFILFMFQLYTMRRGGLFYATGVCQLCTSVAVFTGAVIYAVHVEEFQKGRPPGGSFGYCFVLAWVAFPLALASGLIYIHLRKRE
ncbi:epithelial membrane protein 3 [Tachyglossus aculeatus]|uniref:epithelial membrane protein 3 n=1 Tax=Tachyglossus aculeatus TaxID=9261 RepID=UPI0018F62E95|nr:epithelial membrane protein 3 [Tachyglossus aculeatus]